MRAVTGSVTSVVLVWGLLATAPSVAAASPAVVSDVAQDTSSEVDVVELDLTGIDPGASAEITEADEVLPDTVAPGVDPDTVPGLEVEDPLGALPDTATTDVLTEQMTVDPFSVMGISWDLDLGLEDVVVQYRTFREGAWTDWGWVAPAEPYIDEAAGDEPSTRGATDAIFVPDSTGVQLIVSSTAGTAQNVKVVLIDPGAGPSGDEASTSSGTPTPAPVPTAADVATDEPAESADDAATATTPPTDEAATESPEPFETPEPAETQEPSAPAEETTAPGVPVEEPATVVSPTSVSVDGPVVGEQSSSAITVPAAYMPNLVLPAATMAQPAIVTRAQWGAPAPVCSGGYGSSTLAAAVHHTASSNSYTAAQVPGLLRGIAEYHTRPEASGGRGWCDVGYNFLVDKFGTIYEGRAGGIDQPVLGIHTGGFNSRVIGVSAIGNYQDASVSAAMAEAISQVIAWKFAQHRIMANTSVTLVSGGGASKYPEGTSVTFSTIFGHRDAQLTSCPGQYLYALLGDIRNRVAQLSNAVVAESPQGAWDLAQGGGSSVRVAGWATDPSTSGAVLVQVLIDGTLTRSFAADKVRSDVGAHSYDTSVTMSAGSHTVCVRYINQGGGSDVHMGCRTITALPSNPVGVIDGTSVTASSITVRGWARDPDSTSPITVHVYVDGKAVAAERADEPRADVQASAPDEAGPNHGFQRTVSANGGKHTVCVYGINVGAGANTKIGCKDVVVPNKIPVGVIDEATAVGTDSISVRGWAFDPDTSNPITVHVYVDGKFAGIVAADDNRSDVGRAYGNGSAHGFSTVVPATAGTHTVCAYAIDSQGGGNPRFDCTSVTVRNAAPIGVIDQVTGGSGTVRVRGWALDPDTTASISVHVYVDGKAVRSVRASASRSDIARAYGLGALHGFDTAVPVSAGTHQVCVYAINATAGSNPHLGCRTATVS
ncbi:N-acetylmuramoyl-L-alanine amidase [Sanguibacter antarcticus]|uniref:N-acetylmuramoyl-L-alanine amidase n=2 Tax=Sanguibacter antarcticus TaxID=372484 RepID=A0A2A9E2U9_9MICO|nr:N-acetylmuramoyl-L-alanine amidase [Sanguibacter antarcticus]